MEFATFCNICFNTENEVEENENALKILISFIGNSEIIKKSKVYFCRPCGQKLESFNYLRNMCTTNILLFRYSYFELKTKLESGNDPDMNIKLRNFIEAKVYNKVESGVCEEVKPSCVDLTNDPYNTITLSGHETSDDRKYLKYGIDLGVMVDTLEVPTQDDTNTPSHSEEKAYVDTKYLKYEDVIEGYKIHTEIDMGDMVDTFELSAPRQYYTYIHTEKKGVRTDIKDEHTDEQPLDIQTQNREKSFDSGTSFEERKQRKIMYKCRTCNKTFKTLSDLMTHERVHTGEKPYKCDVCEKAFSQRRYLTLHQRVHTGEKPYKCNVCGKGFSKSSHLTSHQRVHTGEKPYKCNLCEKAFSDSSPLTRHQRVHTGEKPYKCNVCAKAFSQSSTLALHQHVHTGKKPYKCNVCEKTFSMSSNLKSHQRVHRREALQMQPV